MAKIDQASHFKLAYLNKHPAWVEVDLKQFTANLNYIRHYLGHKKLCLPIKANAYGLGLIPIAKAAEKAGVEYLAVSCLQEAAKLREEGILCPILLLGAVFDDQIEDLINHDIEFTVSSPLRARQTIEYCLASQRKAKVHLEVDTGMSRTGMRYQTAYDVYHLLKSEPLIEIKGIYGHLPSACEKNHPSCLDHIAQFKTLINKLDTRGVVIHLGSSAAFQNYEKELQFTDMFRIGILSYGYTLSQAITEVRPIASIKSRVSYFKVVPAGTGISYKSSFITQKQSRIATVPIGYGDGFLRSLSNKASVLIRGKRYRVVGQICMDQFMVEIGDGEAYVGDEVVLVGMQGYEVISLEEVACAAGSIPYEMMALLGNRLVRRYL